MSTMLRASRHAAELEGRAEAERFLFRLYPGGLFSGEWLELRCLDCSQTPAKEGPRAYYRSITDLVNTAMTLRYEWDVFFGVGIRRCPATHDIRQCPHPSRGADHVSRFPGCWADLDVRSTDEPDKPYTSLLEALEALHEAPMPPQVIVCSGMGLHAYWVAEQPLPPTEHYPVEHNKVIRDRLRGDNVVDAARILRLPGTYNHKHGHPLPVYLIEGGQA